MDKDNNNLKIQCMKCKKYYHYIAPAHLKKCCGLTTKQYMEKYPNSEIISEECRKKLTENGKGKNNHQYIDNISRDEIIKMAKDGMTQKEISEFFKISRITILRRLKEYNIDWKKISTFSSKGKISPMKGKKQSVESNKKRSKTLKDRVFTIDHRKKIGDGNRDKKRTDEQKINYRIGAIKRVEDRNGQIFPNYNKNACKYFDWLNKTLEWNGQHAENGNEYYIKELGYFLDYYEPNLNLVIEWDESYHFDKDNNLKEKDIKRENEIKNYLKCGFIRINEKNMKEFLSKIGI